MWLILEISVLDRKIFLGLLMSLRNNANLSSISKETKLIDRGRRKNNLGHGPFLCRTFPNI